MPGFEEDFFVNMLKQQYRLESELENMKVRMLVDCIDFNSITAFRLFNPPKDRSKNLGLTNIVAAFANLNVPVPRNAA